jgi:hypothetical protein
MAWSWSHTADAYAAAEENVRNKDREWLEIVFAEWHACPDPVGDPEEFDEKKYDKALQRAARLPETDLAAYVWDRMSEYAICTNGGFEAYACPCGCHLVSFDREEPEQEQPDLEQAETDDEQESRPTDE